jgi:hypothetical protein
MRYLWVLKCRLVGIVEFVALYIEFWVVSRGAIRWEIFWTVGQIDRERMSPLIM